MVKLPLRDLEEAATDPIAYRTKMTSNNASSGPRYGYFNVLRNAIRRFHESGGNETAARRYLQDGIDSFVDNLAKREDTEDKLDWYIDIWRSSSLITVDTMSRITVPLPSRSSSDLTCSGEITRVDIVPTGGYAGWLFRNNNIDDWLNELRMPLIQETLAQTLGVSSSQVTVGVYGFPQRDVQQTTYAPSEIRAAYSSLDNLLTLLGL
jgi:hypothetical protein